MKCKCGYKMDEGCKFCPECGAESKKETHLCSKCSQPLVPDQKFCSACGAAVLREEPVCHKAIEAEEVEKASMGMLKVISAYQCGQEYGVIDGMVVGKGTDVDISLPEDSYLSHEHARISVRDEKVFLKDLDSRNGIFVQLMDEQELSDGDRILIGTTVFEYSAPEPSHG